MSSARPGTQAYDVVVIGGGNAGLSAALSARQLGASVVVLERAPRAFRGGNSRHTRNLRCMHQAPQGPLVGVYSDEEFLDDLRQVAGGAMDEPLARLVVRDSATCLSWMTATGVRFQSALRGTLQLERTNTFFLGGGKALLNTYYAAAERSGIRVVYDADVVALDIEDGRFRSASVVTGSEEWTVHGKAAILAAGGFESNLAWLRDIWGEVADNFIIRGTPYNTGTILKILLDAGAQSVGDATHCHAVAVDARAPKFDGGIVTRLDCISLGIVVNAHAERFYDEGEDFWPKRYAIWGRLIAEQPGQIAFCLVDAKTAREFLPSVFPPYVADTIPALARQLGLSPDRLTETVTAFNRAVQPGTFDHRVLDECRTAGLTPEKSHWAQPLDTPPFWGYPMRPGITFTYLGLKVDDHAQVVMTSARPAANIFAAGEIMAGNILAQGYVAGVGMTIGTVFGRIAGQRAAEHARG